MLKTKAPGLRTIPCCMCAASQTIPYAGQIALLLCPRKPGVYGGSRTWRNWSRSCISIISLLPLVEGTFLGAICNNPISPGVIWWATYQCCQQPPLPLPLPLFHVVLGIVCTATWWTGRGNWIPGKTAINSYISHLFFYFFFSGFFSQGLCTPSVLPHCRDSTAGATQQNNLPVRDSTEGSSSILWPTESEITASLNLETRCLLWLLNIY